MTVRGPYGALFACWLVGCGGAPIASSASSTSRAPGPESGSENRGASATLPAADPDEPWAIAYWPPYGGDLLRSVGREPDGARRIVASRLRALARDGSIEWSPEFPAYDVPGSMYVGIVAERSCGGAWVFVTADGTAYRAETFLGSLTEVGRLGERALMPLGPGSGVLLTATGAERVECDGRFTALALEPGRSVLAAASDGAARTVVIVSPGTASLVTATGTLEEIDLGATDASDAWSVEGALFVATDGGTLALAPDGTLDPVTGDVTAADVVEPDLDVRLNRSIIELYPFGFRWPRADGRIALDMPGDDGLEVWEPELGAFRPVAAPDGAVGSCHYSTWGPPGTLAVCWDATVTQVFGTDDDRTWDHLADIEGTAVYPSTDGVGFLSDHDACGGPPMESVRSLCWHVGPQTRRVIIATEEPAWRILQLGDESIVLHRASGDDTEEAVVATFDEPDVWRPVHIADPTFRPALFQPCGPSCITASAVAPDARIAVGPPLGVLEAHPLPAGAVTAALCDPIHGIAVGDDLRMVFSTRDGGASWQPLSLPGLRGDLDTRTFVAPSPGDGGGVWSAGPGVCGVSPGIAYGASRLLASAPSTATHHPLLPSVPPPPAPLEPEISFEANDVDLGQWTCETEEGVERPIADDVDLPPSVWGGHFTDEAGNHHFEWHGADTRGPFTGTASPPAPSEDWDRWELLHATRRWALFLSTSDSYDRLELAIARPGGAWTSLRTLTPVREAAQVNFGGVFSGTDGSVLVHVFDGGDAVLALDARGAEVGFRRYRWPGAIGVVYDRVLARAGTTVGLATVIDGEVVLHPIDRSAPRSLGRLASGTVSACTGRARPAAPLVLRAESDVAIAGDAMGGGGMGWSGEGFSAVIELAPSGACVRNIVGGPANAATRLERGVLSGWWIDATRDARFRCEVAAPTSDEP